MTPMMLVLIGSDTQEGLRRAQLVQQISVDKEHPEDTITDLVGPTLPLVYFGTISFPSRPASPPN
ncbi:hypothetical protein FRB93_013406 [Tulasnella sp. JGI-2019a]|nr:hypothetical protein FRB93_013406 [Tulasnella sp. JGI-2019a]